MLVPWLTRYKETWTHGKLSPNTLWAVKCYFLDQALAECVPLVLTSGIFKTST